MTDRIKVIINQTPSPIKIKVSQQIQDIGINLGMAKPVTTMHGNEWHYKNYEDSVNKENGILDYSIEKFPTNNLVLINLDLKENLINKANNDLDYSAEKYPTNNLVLTNLNLKENLANKTNNNLDSSTTKYPTNNLVLTNLNLKENLINKENITLDYSTTKYPTNKLVHDNLNLKENLENKENITLDNSITKYPTNNLVKHYIDQKVDKVSGRGLSDQNFTLDEKNKLSLIEDQANNYLHPDTHPASMIVESLQRLFVTTEQVSAWNDKWNFNADEIKVVKVNEAKNADTVNNLTVKTAVPENALFTDTIYTHPTLHSLSMISETSTRKIMTNLERTKLSGIEAEANKYVHPSSHSLSMITETETEKIMTDSEREKLEGIESNANNYLHPESHDLSMINETETQKIMTDLEREKLQNIEDNANNYTHPESHGLDMITETETEKIMTDLEREKLEGIESSANNYTHPESHSLEIMTETEELKIMTSSEREKLEGIENSANNYTHPESHDLSMINETEGLKIMTDSEREKLEGIENNANNYVHPESHDPSIIIQDENNRFVSDTQINTWDGKPDQGLVEHGADWHDGTIKTYAGFENREDSEIYISPAGLFTLSPKSPATSFNIYITGKTVYKLDSLQSMQIEADQTLTYLYIDINGNLQKSLNAWDIEDGTNIPCAIVFKDGLNYALTDERHGHERNKAWHKWAHNNIGAMYKNGLQGTFSNSTLSITQGVIYDEDLVFDTLITQTSTSLWYRNATNGMRMTRNSTAARGLTDGNILAYDNGSGILQPVDNNRYVTNWVYATNDPEEPIYTIVGQNNSTIADARNTAFPIINLSTAEWKLIYRIIYQRTSGEPTGVFIEASDYRNVQTGVPTSASSPTSHASLSERELDNSHPATAITQSETHRFVSDTQINTWDGITDPNFRKAYVVPTTPLAEDIDEGALVFVYQE